MQLYALDSKGLLVSARHALRKAHYQCLECRQTIRMRGGPYRQPHFYHVNPTPFCRQHQKGPIHLQLQSYFLQQFPFGDCQLEYPFPSIGRIADVVWLSQKMIFEIQCSPIAPEEVLARNRDYQKLGWTVVWILHDQRYRQSRLSAAELALHACPHFFSNMNQFGKGMIYDQFQICENGIRKKWLPPLPVQINEIVPLSKEQSYPLMILEERARLWNLSFSGDLMSLFLKNSESTYIRQAIEMEKLFFAPRSFNWRHLPSQVWYRGIANPYRILLHFLLERMCR